MAKKRRTKQQKIIARLKRQLAQQKTTVTGKKQETQKTEVKKEKEIKERKPVSSDNDLFFYNPTLVKKDLLKTVIFSLIILIIIGIFYWSIELNGIKLILRSNVRITSPSE